MSKIADQSLAHVRIREDSCNPGQQDWRGEALTSGIHGTAVSHFLCPLLLALIWVCMVVLTNPAGDFPLNDDWAYGYSVRGLLEQGQLRFSDWTATNLLGQVLWGSLFCWPFGFSFTTLRLSTAVLGLVGVLATYGILRELKTSRFIAVLGALTLASCPIYFALSLTFMTDVPFTAFAVASIYFFMRGTRKQSRLMIAASFALAAVAILIRQTGLALPVAFACALLTKKGIRPRYVISALILAASGIAVQFAYQSWLFNNGLAPAKYNNQVFSLIGQTHLKGRQLLREGVRISYFCLMYVGLFAAPLLPLLLLNKQRDTELSRKKTLVATGLILGILTVELIRIGDLMPIWRNILDKGGVGPYPIMNSEILWAPEFVLIAVTGVSLLGGTVLVKRLISVVLAVYSDFRAWSGGYHCWALILLLSVLAISFAPLPLLGLGDFGFYDRYVLIFVPVAIAIILSRQTGKSSSRLTALATGIAILLVGVYAVFSVAATHDYLALNRMRWTALHDLMGEKGVSASRINGGRDFNGWYFYNEYSKDRKREWFWFERDDFLVAFCAFDNYEIIRRYPVERWLPWKLGAGSVLVERRIAGKPWSDQLR